MYKAKDFFNRFSRSTKVTIISCGIFILLAFIILMFFVLFPITPSEKIISGMGRSSLLNSDGKNANYSDSQLDGVIVTTASVSNQQTSNYNTQVTKSKVNYTDKIFTNNEGYVYTGNAFPVGEIGHNSYEYSVVEPDNNSNYNNNHNNNHSVYEPPVESQQESSYESSSESSEPDPSEPDYSEPDSSSEPDYSEPDYSEPDSSSEPDYSEPDSSSEPNSVVIPDPPSSSVDEPDYSEPGNPEE